MSDWIDIKKENISIENGIVTIFFEADEFGNRYITFPIEFIKELTNTK